jgi:hypothetical protein
VASRSVAGGGEEEILGEGVRVRVLARLARVPARLARVPTRWEIIGIRRKKKGIEGGRKKKKGVEEKEWNAAHCTSMRAVQR